MGIHGTGKQVYDKEWKIMSLEFSHSIYKRVLESGKAAGLTILMILTISIILLHSFNIILLQNSHVLNTRYMQSQNSISLFVAFTNIQVVVT